MGPMTDEQLLDVLLLAIPRMEPIPYDVARRQRRLDEAMAARDDEDHACVICAKRARFVIVAGPSDLFGVARWMDLCVRCDAGMRHLMNHWPGDDAALQRLAYLRLEGFVTQAS
jgi:hypothetical protein